MIEVKNLVKRYGDHTAVDHLSFTVNKGQVLGFLGPNGAGKSTTMNIITGYISATEGTVTINGLDVFEEPEEVKKMIGYLPEFPPLYPDMTVKEYLYFAADIKKVKKAGRDKAIAEVMDSTKITPMANRLIKHLSKGYKQRVGLAQAILGDPELIILDEPTVGLDPKQIIEIRDLIRKLSKNHTIILSSHIMQEVSAVCDTILIIDRGKLVVADTPENLIHHFGNTGDLKLTVKGNKDKVINALKKVEGIHKIEQTKSYEAGTVELNVFCDENSDVRERIFHAMHEANTPLLEMQTKRLTLEDIYLMATRDKRFEQLEKLTEEETVPEKETVPEEVTTSEEAIQSEEEEKSDAGNL